MEVTTRRLLSKYELFSRFLQKAALTRILFLIYHNCVETVFFAFDFTTFIDYQKTTAQNTVFYLDVSTLQCTVRTVSSQTRWFVNRLIHRLR